MALPYFCNIHLHFSSKKFGDSKYYHYLCSRKNEQPHITHIFGEWLKRHAWKACKPLKGFTGSNPVLSASSACKNLQALFVFFHFSAIWQKCRIIWKFMKCRKFSLVFTFVHKNAYFQNFCSHFCSHPFFFLYLYRKSEGKGPRRSNRYI